MLLRFGTCEIRVRHREVWLDGRLQPAPPKVFDLLMCLLQKRHRVVEKRELIDMLSPKHSVSDAVLARTVMQARKAIGDTAVPPVWIKTIHRYGYRFIGRVFESEETVSTKVPIPDADQRTVSNRLRVGILPCRNQTGESSLDWIQHGLMTLIGHALETDPRLDVVPVATLLEAIGKLSPDVAEQERVQVALQVLGLGRVVHSSFRRQGFVFCLDYQIVGDGSSLSGSLRGDDAAQLGERFARVIDENLFPGHGAAVEFESRDPFVNQAFARAIEAYTRTQWDSGVRMMGVVCGMEPKSAVAKFWHLRFRALTGDPTAHDAGETLLAQARRTEDVQLQVSIHLLLGHAMAHWEEGTNAARLHMNEALRLVEGQGRPDWVNLVHLRLAQDAQERGEREWALELYRQAGAGFRTVGNSLHSGVIEHNVAALTWGAGDVLRAKQGFEDALAMLRKTRRDALAMHTLARLAEVNASFGLFQLAESQCHEAVAAIARIENSEAAASIIAHAACVLAGRGTRLDIERLLERATGLEGDARPGVQGPLSLAHAWRDWLRCDAGEVRRRAREAAEDKSFHRASARSLLALWLRAECTRGDAARIRAAREFISHWAGSARLPGLQACVLLSEAAEACARGDSALALSALLVGIEECPFGQVHALARLNAAWLSLELGDSAQAELHLRGAGAWRTEHPAGLATEARLKFVHKQFDGAVAWQRRCLSTFRGPAPTVHENLLLSYAAAAESGSAPALAGLRQLICESWISPGR